MTAHTPLRICQVVTYDLAPEGGGVKQHALHLAEALRRRGDEVTVLGPSSRALEDPQVVGVRGVVNVKSNGSDNYLGIFPPPWTVRRFLRQQRFDVIHVHEPLNPTVSYLVTWLTREVPHLATFHAYAEEDPPRRLRARRFWGRTIFPWFQRAIAVSEPAARYAAQAWKGPIAVVPNGVPARLFRPLPVALAERPGPLKLLFVGRLGDQRKGVRYLIDAFARLQSQGARVTLDLCGELGEAPLPPRLPGLTYHGAVTLEQLVARYRACDALVAPSTGQESFGIILLEAMASAKPIICSDIEGYRQVVVAAGARLVPPRDALALEKAIGDLAAAGPVARRRMGEANLEHARQYDWDRVARRVRAEYLAVLGLASERALELASTEADGDATATGTR